MKGNDDFLDAELAPGQCCMHWSTATADYEREFAGVVPPLNRNELERIDHICVDHADDGNCRLRDGGAKSLGYWFESGFGLGDVERELTNGKIVGIDDACYKLRIRNCWLRAAASIRCGRWIRASANGTNVKRTHLVDPSDGATSSTDLNDVDNGRPLGVTKFGARPFEFIFRRNLRLSPAQC